MMEAIKTTVIPRVKDLSKEDFIKNYYIPQKPVLIENLTQNWDALKKWNLDYIQSLSEDKIVPLYNNEVTKGKQKSAAPVTEMKLYDYIEILKNTPTDLRIFFFDIMKEMPVLVNDFKFPDLGIKFFKRLPVMFFGGKGSKVLAHFDMDLANLIHVHFHGTKKVILFSPNQTKYLYKIPFAVHNIEEINLDQPDFKKYPALKQVIGQEIIMKHGDALFMPSAYWHYITYLDGGFSITLRSFSKKPKVFLKMLYNVFFMRHFENLMRKLRGQKWIDYKNQLALDRTNKNLKNKK
ncbi:MAG: cupin-like domain-containing protein [Flavobacteriales bacterium]